VDLCRPYSSMGMGVHGKGHFGVVHVEIPAQVHGAQILVDVTSEQELGGLRAQRADQN